MNDFELPKTVPNKPADPRPIHGLMPAIPAANIPFAPAKPRDTTIAVNDISGTKADEIKAWLRLLTHREMRELVKEIYAAHATLFKPEMSSVERAIKIAELPDVLDKIAHGD